MKNSAKIFRLTYLAILTALTVVLCLLQTVIRWGMFEINLSLLVIVLAAITCGPLAGAWIGLVSGFMTVISPATMAFMGIHVIGTIITCLLKTAVAGLCCGLIYQLLKKLNKYLAVAIAAAACPLVNSLVFALGTLVFFWDTISEWAAAVNMSAGAFLVFGMIMVNFIAEIIYTTVLSPIVCKLIDSTKLNRYLK